MRNKEKERITWYVRRDQNFLRDSSNKTENYIKYDFKDPVLNKENNEA